MTVLRPWYTSSHTDQYSYCVARLKAPSSLCNFSIHGATTQYWTVFNPVYTATKTRALFQRNRNVRLPRRKSLTRRYWLGILNEQGFRNCRVRFHIVLEYCTVRCWIVAFRWRSAESQQSAEPWLALNCEPYKGCERVRLDRTRGSTTSTYYSIGSSLIWA